MTDTQAPISREDEERILTQRQLEILDEYVDMKISVMLARTVLADSVTEAYAIERAQDLLKQLGEAQKEGLQQ